MRDAGGSAWAVIARDLERGSLKPLHGTDSPWSFMRVLRGRSANWNEPRLQPGKLSPTEDKPEPGRVSS